MGLPWILVARVPCVLALKSFWGRQRLGTMNLENHTEIFNQAMTNIEMKSVILP